MRLWFFGILIWSNAFCTNMAWAQPNDHSLDLVFFSSQGFMHCSPRSGDVMAGQVKEHNGKKVFIPTDTMRCVDVQGEIDERLYSQYWRGRSWENTRAVRIVAGKDTMYLDTELQPIHWKLNPYGGMSKFPLPVYFQPGWHIWGDYKDRELDRMYYNSINRKAILRDMPLEELTQSGKSSCPTNRELYVHGDTVKVQLNGLMMTDGSCADYTPLSTLMRLDGSSWIICHELCCTQMDCGMGRRNFDHEQVVAFKVNSSGAKEIDQTWQTLHLQPGTYRLAYYRPDASMMLSNAFVIQP